MNRNPRTVVIVYSPTPRYASMTAALTATLGALAAGISKELSKEENKQSCASNTSLSASYTGLRSYGSPS